MPDTPLSHAQIEKHAAEEFERLMGKLSPESGRKRDLQQFMQLIEKEIAGHDFASSEMRVGFLIALTGLIHDYLENEHGVRFKPR